MFCPSCAAQNDTAQHYCRMCGLKLDAITAEVTAQKPSAGMSELFKRQRRMEMFGVGSLSIAAVIGLMLLLSRVFYYKLMIFGPEVLFGSAVGALILFLLASLFFFHYPKLFMKPRPHHSDESEPSSPTNKLLNDPPFEPASVTEHSTELLHRK
jgi:hypothetical protein